MTRIISLDIETSGLDPLKHEILQLAAVDLESGIHFYEKINYHELLVQPEALKMNKIDLSKKEGNNPRQTAVNFQQWLSSICCDHEFRQFNKHCFTFMGFNIGSFDVRFLIEFLKKNRVSDLLTYDAFNYSSIDLNSITYFTSSLEGRPFDAAKGINMNLAKAKIQIHKPTVHVLGQHNALYDAWLNVYYYETIRKLFPKNCKQQIESRI